MRERIVPPAISSLNRTAATEVTAELHLCEHFDPLGVSAVIATDLNSRDIIHCCICSLRFQLFTEGSRIIVGKVEPA